MGGTEMVLDFDENIKIDAIRDLFVQSGFSNVSIQNYGNKTENEFLIRLPISNESENSKLSPCASTIHSAVSTKSSPVKTALGNFAPLSSTI